MLGMILIFFLLLACSAFFSCSETAMFSLSRLQLHRFQRSRSAMLQRVVAELQQPRRLLVTILLGNELVNVSISIVGAALINMVVPADVIMQTLIAVAAVTPVILFAGELAPKSFALRAASDVAPVIIFPLQFFRWFTSPLRRLLTSIADGVIRLGGGDPKAAQPMIMEEEFRNLVDIGHREGVIVEEEHEMLHNVFEFSDKVVRDIMTPSENLFMLPVDISYEQMMGDIRATAFSRIPVYDGQRNNVIGILHVHDLLSFQRRRTAGEEQDFCSLLMTPIYVDQDEPIEGLLRQFQRGHAHMAMVIDRNRALVGAVTMHDVLETLFGEIEE